MVTRYAKREIKSVITILCCSTVAMLFSAVYQDCPYVLILLLPVLALGGVGLWFFRDPEREVPDGEERMVSPADGVVVEVCESEHPFVGAAKKVAIFMSLFDVHINRVPLSGEVVKKEFKKGEFLNASRADASHRNEALDMCLITPFGKVVVRQVAGIVARKIVNEADVGEKLQKGMRYGMIKYGSRLEVFVSSKADFKVTVAVGERVKAGESVIGEFRK